MADNMRTDELINKASSLLQQFEKVLSQIEPRKARSAPVAAEDASSKNNECDNVAENQNTPHVVRQQQQQCRGNDSMIKTASSGISRSDRQQLIATNESNYTHQGCCGGPRVSPRVCMQSSEIRLILKLDTWMSDTGTLMIRPSIFVDSGDLSANDGEAMATAPAAGKLQAIPTAVKTVQCGGENSEEECQAANEAIPKQMRKKQKREQQQSKKQLHNLSSGHQEIAIQLGAVNTGGSAKLPTRKTIPTAVKAVQCCSNTSDEESQAAFVSTHPQQSQKQQQQSDRHLKNLNNGVRKTASQLGAVNNGGRRARAGNLDKLPTLQQRRPDYGLATGAASFAVHQSDGDGRRRNNHHDNVSDRMPDQSEANSFSSDQSAISPEGDCDACTQPEDPMAESTGALLQRLLGLIEKDSSSAMHPRE